MGRYFLGIGPPPEEWLVAVIASTFHISTSEALADIESGPAGLAETAIDLLTFDRRWREARMEPAEQASRGVTLDAMRDLVDDIMPGLLEEELIYRVEEQRKQTQA